MRYSWNVGFGELYGGKEGLKQYSALYKKEALP